MLNEALAGAAADVALLFQRWDEKNALEDANGALVQVWAAALLCKACCGSDRLAGKQQGG